ncbi:MAG: 30S ribosomal protein S3 [Candidatus Omnitrophica bacterium]|nr:30S ribosomal protein S3 [Candidatus Omnitrophota bacterium]
MGQKAHPYGLRLGYIRSWKAKWFSGKKDYTRFLHEDLKVRKHIKKEIGSAGIANIEIERFAGKMRVRIFTARPGIIIGRRGQEIDRIKETIGKISPNEVLIDIKEVKVPQIDAQLVAENVALQMEKRVAFRKAMKKAVTSALAKGAGGVKILCAGRLGGAEIARTEGYKEGKVPLNTFRADVDYGFSEAFTTYGTIGVKVWIYKGDVLVKKEEAEDEKERVIRFRKHQRPEKTDVQVKGAVEAAVEPPKEIAEDVKNAAKDSISDATQSSM